MTINVISQLIVQIFNQDDDSVTSVINNVINY